MKEQPELKVYEVLTADLIPYANNAKIHTREQVDQIASSIEEFGFNDPIACWHNADGNMEIIEGHGRVMAAKKLGISKLPVIYLDHMSDEQRRAYTHVHNQLTMNTSFDFDMLAMEMNELLDFQWQDFGFEQIATDIDSLFENYETPQEKEKEPEMVTCPHCGESFEL